MGKALVIKNVDFSTNKIETVTFTDPIPCTGISLSANSISFTKLTTSTITATVTPIDTTDELIWISSDTDVATVSDGVVTAVGLGQATITATCGLQTATCSVSVSVVMTEADLVKLLHRYNSGTNLSATPPKDYVGCYGEESSGYLRATCVLTETVTASGYKAITGTDSLYDGKYPIMIPKNAESILITSSTLSLEAVFYSWLNSTEHPTDSSQGKGCLALSNVLSSSSVSSNTITLTIPTDLEGLDSTMFGVKFTTQITEETSTGISITFA